MHTLQRSAVRSISRAQPRALQQRICRRFAHDEHSHGHEAPKAEPLGASFYTIVALIPTSFIVFQLSSPGANGEPSSLTKLIDTWSNYKEQNAVRNALHTRLVEEAAHDKNLFLNTNTVVGSRHHDMRFPEVMGVGSPRAVPAGSRVDLTQVTKHYEDVNHKEEAEKLRQLKEGKIPGQEQYKGL